MKPIQIFSVSPSLPEALEPLRDVARNLRWAWNHDSIELFRRLDDELWEKTQHNPVLMLGMISQHRLQDAAEDEGFKDHLTRVSEDLRGYLSEKSTWFERTHPEVGTDRPLTAYFSAEFGLTECLEIFAGGLGVLAADHLKSSSDLGVPLVGVGLLYQEGYFRQYLNEAGWQQEVREENDFHNLPLELERGPDGAPLTIEVDYPDQPVTAQIWRAQVGRVPLYLLDTNIPANTSPDARDLTDELYGGDNKLRIRQEIMLGVGGHRALRALGLDPAVYHLNEGHPAFLVLERIRCLMQEEALSFAEAKEVTAASSIFTTHTPVAAGHDYFSPDLIRRHFESYAQELDVSIDEILELGRENSGRDGDPFCMTTLALRLSTRRNAVSELHGEVTREMWQSLWPGLPHHEVPIDHVTNGVHFRSWISLEMNRLYDRYLGPRWREEPADREVWGRAKHIAASELWRTHERRRERLVAFARRRLRAQREQRGAPQSIIEAADEVLDPEALTIGFARRFATYKRATLLLKDRDRLARILADPDRPVQIIYAGKAHPKDEAGKKLIAEIVSLSHQDPFQRHLVFLEDYGMATARYLVQGCDVWLNTPRRPREASGTSGMKAVANGVLNLSILDGWWAEAYQPEYGWAIGRGEVYEDHDLQDRVEAKALYDLLEQDVVPTFYDQGSDGIPRKWIEHMKASIGNLCHFFNTHRMVQEYTEALYLPAAGRYQEMAAEGMSRFKPLAAWKKRVRESWPRVCIEQVEATSVDDLQVGETFRARARVVLGDLTPGDVQVEFYVGRLNADGEIVDPRSVVMDYVEAEGEEYVFAIDDVSCATSGRHGYTARVLPCHADLVTPYMPGLITWADA